MTTERIKTIRDALLPLDDAWDALNSLLAELDAARAERDNAIDENIRLMNAETEALRAQLAAASAREQALTETFNERVNWIQVVEARWHSAEAREAKLREALKDVLPQAIHSRHCALRPCRCPIKTARAALAEGEDTK